MMAHPTVYFTAPELTGNSEERDTAVSASGLMPPEQSPSAPRLPRAAGVLSRVVTSAFRRHDAGWPKYTQTNAPHALGWFLAATGTTREGLNTAWLYPAPDPAPPADWL